MLERSREVLDDAWHAVDLLDAATDQQTFRVLWVASISLARAVGHVLKNVDGPRDPAIAAAALRAWESWRYDSQANEIFWGFIDDERNLALKEYELTFGSAPAALVVDGDVFGLSDTGFCCLADGPFSGEDCRDVLRQALEWWERQLEAIEEAAKTWPSSA